MYPEAELQDLKNTYIVLNVPFTTPAPLIKKAYRTLIKRLHPYLIPFDSQEQINAIRRLQEINAAYDKKYC